MYTGNNSSYKKRTIKLNVRKEENIGCFKEGKGEASAIVL